MEIINHVMLYGDYSHYHFILYGDIPVINLYFASKRQSYKIVSQFRCQQNVSCQQCGFIVTLKEGQKQEQGADLTPIS